MATRTNNQKSKLHDLISKDSTKMLIAVSVSVFIVIFCLFAAKSLFSQSLYQNKIISEKKATLKVVKQNKDSVKDLESSYVSFATESVNVLGGNPTGTGPQDGDNAKLVLDSLPDQLDYPALSSSIEKILVDGGYVIQSIGGGDATATGISSKKVPAPSGQSSPVEIPYPFRVATTPQSALTLLKTLEASIRPFKLNAIKIEGGSNNLELTIDMTTYYQDSSGLQVTEKVVK